MFKYIYKIYMIYTVYSMCVCLHELKDILIFKTCVILCSMPRQANQTSTDVTKRDTRAHCERSHFSFTESARATLIERLEDVLDQNTPAIRP